MVTNARHELANALREALPPKWLVLNYWPTLDNPDRVTILVRQSALVRTPGAPRLYRDVTVNVGLVEPGLDPALVEDALDEDLELLIDALESIPIDGLRWEGASRSVFQDRWQGYDVTTTITTEKD